MRLRFWRNTRTVVCVLCCLASGSEWSYTPSRQVYCVVGEWVPFGSNQIVALNQRLGAMDRCQGGLFSAAVDEDPAGTDFEVHPGLTRVTILDYDRLRFINFEAEIHMPEVEGVIQVCAID